MTLRDEYTGSEFADAGAAALWAVRYVLQRQMRDVDTQYQIGIGSEVHRRCCLAVAFAEGRDPREVEAENTMRSPEKSTIERLREQLDDASRDREYDLTHEEQKSWDRTGARLAELDRQDASGKVK